LGVGVRVNNWGRRGRRRKKRKIDKRRMRKEEEGRRGEGVPHLCQRVEDQRVSV
jgi:hypothetical protein